MRGQSMSTELSGDHNDFDDESDDGSVHRELINDSLTRMIQRLAGEVYPDLTVTPTACWEYIHHPNPNVREAALTIIDKLDDNSEETYRIVCDVIAAETCEGPRMAAIFCLDRFRETPWEQSTCQLLAKIVVDPDSGTIVRSVAYKTLLAIAGRVRQWDTNLLFLRIPEDIDWDFVSLYLSP